MGSHLFLSYSRVDGHAIATRVRKHLVEGHPPCRVWRDSQDIPAGYSFPAEIEDAIRTCAGVVYLMTPDSVSSLSFCLKELSRANRFKKPIYPVLAERAVAPPIDLELAQTIDLHSDFAAGMERLRHWLSWAESPEGKLRSLAQQRAWLQRELTREAPPAQRLLVLEELARVDDQIRGLESWIADPERAQERKAAQIRGQMETLRQVEASASPRVSTRFVNSGAFVAPVHFQDRHTETRLAIEFLRDPSLRLLTLVGRGGVGKTAMVCRLLKGIETGVLPDDLGNHAVSGLVYLSEQRMRRVSFPHLYEDLTRLLDPVAAERAEALYRSPETSPKQKMLGLLPLLPAGQVVVMLDNFEELVAESDQSIKDRELHDALLAWLQGPPNEVKVILTTRVMPVELARAMPARCREVWLDEGLAPPFAEALLRTLDADRAVGLHDAPSPVLQEAARRVRGFPRALEALYSVLRNDRNTSLEEVLARTEHTLPDQVVEVMVGEAYSRLDAQDKRILQALAVFGRPVPAVALDFLLQPFEPALQVLPALRWLVHLQVVRKDRDRYYLHPVDAGHALRQLPPEEAPDGEGLSLPALLKRAAAYFREMKKPAEDWNNIEDLEPNLAEFDLLCQSGQFEAAAEGLLAIGFKYLRSWGHIPLLIQLHERLQGKPLPPATHANCLGILGVAYEGIGQMEKAIQHLEACIALTEETSGAQSCAPWWCDLAICHRNQGQSDKALAGHEKALVLDFQTRDPSGMAIDLHNIGEVYGDFGWTTEGLRCVGLALAAIPHVERDAKNANSLKANRLPTLAQLLIDEDRLDEAVKAADEGLAAALSMGYSVAISRAGYYLALARLLQGDYARSGFAAGQVLEAVYPAFKCRALLLQGIGALARGDRREAAEIFTTCAQACRELLQDGKKNREAALTLGLAITGQAACGQAENPDGAKQALAAAAPYLGYPGIRRRWERLLALLARLDSSGCVRRLGFQVEALAGPVPPPAPLARPVLGHPAMRAWRAGLAPARLSAAHARGLFEEAAAVAADGQEVADLMHPHSRNEFSRMRAWVQARRGWLDGPAILDALDHPPYLESLLRLTDYLAVYRYQGLLPSPELLPWAEKADSATEAEPDAGASVLVEEYLGCAKLAWGDTGEAEALLRRAHERENGAAADPRILARIQASLGEACRRQGRQDQAESLLERAAAVQEEHGFDGDLHEYTLPSLAKLQPRTPYADRCLDRVREWSTRTRHHKALLRLLLLEARLRGQPVSATDALAEVSRLAAGLPALAACPAWQRIRTNWPAWLDAGQDFWGL